MQKNDNKKETVNTNQIDKMEEKFNDVLKENDISEEDAAYVREMLNKIKIDISAKMSTKNRILMIIKRTFYNLATYFVIYLAMLGIFNKGIVFSNRSIVILVALGLTIYQILAQIVIKKLIKTDKYYPQMFFIFSLVTVLIAYIINENNELFYFNNTTNLILYYLVCEIIIFMFMFYRIKRLFNKL